MIDTILFDMDGTLLYTLDDLLDGCNHALRALGRPSVTKDDVVRNIGRGIEYLVARMVGGESDPGYPQALAAFRAWYDVHSEDKTVPYDGVFDLLRALKQRGYKTAVVSNKYHSAVVDLHRRLFADTIDAAFGSTDDARRKPAPDLVLRAIEALGSSTDRAVYVGDSEIDLATAQNTGLPHVLCTWGYRSRAFLAQQGGQTFIDAPMQLLDWLDAQP